MTGRIVHLSTARSWRGGEQQLAYLVTELGRMGVDQLVVCAPRSLVQAFCARNSIAHQALRLRLAFDPFAARRLSSLARSWGADLLHAHDSHGHTIAVLANALSGMRLPLVVSRRVDFPISNGLSARFKYGHPSVKRILCVSEAIRGITAKGLQDPTVLRTVHSGIDPVRFAAGPDGRLRRELGIAREIPLIGNVAALAPHKDLFTFIRMAGHIARERVETRFVLIGEGELRAELEAEAARHGLSDVLHFTGFRDDVDRILPELDVMAMTSVTEGLGTAVLDAFACGVPVIATAAGGIPEMVDHERTGLLAPVGDDAALAAAALRLLRDPALRSRLVSSAKVRLRDFTTGATALKTLTEYQAVLEEGRNEPKTNRQ